MPDELEHGLAAYRADDAPQARALLSAIAGTGRTAVSGHAAMALAGIELGEKGLGDSCRKWLEQVAAGEDPWLGPLAAVMLAPEFQPYTSLDSHPVLVRSLAAQLTGDLDAARNGFEQAVDVHKDTETENLATLLLGNLLLQSGDQAAALEPLSYARQMYDGLFAGYAGYLEGHILIGQDEKNQAGNVLNYAHGESHPATAGSKGLHPWVAVRFGELLAGDMTSLDLVYDQMEESGVSEGTVVREPFESALHRKEISRPALIDIGFHLFPYSAEFGPVHAGLERLKTWSDERYERGRRLVLALHTHVEDWRNERRTRGLAELREKLDLPKPH
ncbi:tetratricopeptide repeat protein [Plantactinospora mayteni]|uniref:tetratricopeptide repeat protein n=1 Tax=Plantactinospora mayteni TaxID=566021 RepID=UPI0019425E0E|nr:tetratricopeptide repeat protein [Plantactinospora mayteni]